MSCRVVPCRVVSCRVVSCRPVPSRAVPCHVVTYRIVSCRAVSGGEWRGGKKASSGGEPKGGLAMDGGASDRAASRIWAAVRPCLTRHRLVTATRPPSSTAILWWSCPPFDVGFVDRARARCLLVVWSGVCSPGAALCILSLTSVGSVGRMRAWHLRHVDHALFPPHHHHVTAISSPRHRHVIATSPGSRRRPAGRASPRETRARQRPDGRTGGYASSSRRTLQRPVFGEILQRATSSRRRGVGAFLPRGGRWRSLPTPLHYITLHCSTLHYSTVRYGTVQ